MNSLTLSPHSSRFQFSLPINHPQPSGRTARSGTEGHVTSLVAPKDVGLYRQIKMGAGYQNQEGKGKGKNMTPLARAAGRFELEREPSYEKEGTSM